MSGHVVLPPDQYVASLARKRMAASALFRDEAGRVLAVDWVPSRPRDGVMIPDGVIIVYDGGILTEAEAKEIVVADGELARFAFVSGDEIAGRVTPLVARRIGACLDAVAAGTVAALENGSPVA